MLDVNPFAAGGFGGAGLRVSLIKSSSRLGARVFTVETGRGPVDSPDRGGSYVPKTVSGKILQPELRGDEPLARRAEGG